MPVALSGPPAGAPGDRIDVGLLLRRARLALRETGCKRSELSLALVEDADIAALNGRYRDRKGATDVLSFSLLEGDHSGHRGELLGDVVIAVETAAVQARERHRGLDEEIAKLMIHGLLHLLGHDHVGAVETREMRAEERRLWRALR